MTEKILIEKIKKDIERINKLNAEIKAEMVVLENTRLLNKAWLQVLPILAGGNNEKDNRRS